MDKCNKSCDRNDLEQVFVGHLIQKVEDYENNEIEYDSNSSNTCNMVKL